MRHLIDPALLAGLDLMPPFDFTLERLPLIRAAMDEMIAMAPESEEAGVAWREESVPAPAGHSVPVRIYRPQGVPRRRPAIVHIHGGGYVMGCAAMNHASNMAMAASLDAVIMSVDYRLAPETRAPGAVEDCYAALCWLVDNAGDLGIDTARIAVRGESAGGGLATALATLSRDRAGPAIIHQNLIYPMLDDRTCITRLPDQLGAFVWTPQANAFGWRALLGVDPGSADVPQYAVPARTDNLAGLPGAFIAVGALDLFVVEDLDYARRLTEAAVPTELHIYPGAYHGFDVLPNAEPAKRMQRDAIAALRRALYPGEAA